MRLLRIPALVLLSTLAAGCASPRAVDGVDGEDPPVTDDGVRIVTALSLLPTSRDVSVAVPGDGYMALFELRPGRALAMIYPPRNELERGEGGRIVDAEPEAGRVEAGTQTVLRPDWTPDFRSSPWRSGVDRHSLGRDVLSYSYYCATTTPRSFGRWLLAVWSPEPLHPEKLWPPRDPACGEPMAGAMTDSLVMRLRGSPEQIVRVDLVEY